MRGFEKTWENSPLPNGLILKKLLYDYLLNSLPYEAKRKVSIYYKEKYQYFLDTQPKQLEFK